MGKTGVSYSPSACVDTFPMPSSNQELIEIGREYHKSRSEIMFSRKIGLTKVYNLFNDSKEDSSDVRLLRDLHVSMDKAVAAAYGWRNLDLGHGFHKTKQGVRFTISEEARREVLQRLLKLNHERYEEEVAHGLHGSGGRRASSVAQRTGCKPITALAQPSLNFHARAASTPNGSSPTAAIVGFLSVHGGWHTRADILAATGITDGQWNAATADLLADGLVERQGERRGARYRAIRKGDLDE